MWIRSLAILAFASLCNSTVGVAEQQADPQSGMTRSLENPNWQNLDATGGEAKVQPGGTGRASRSRESGKSAKKSKAAHARRQRRPHH